MPDAIEVVIARGGRYDGIGEAFGRGRPATGFSTDLRTLAKFALRKPVTETQTIWAPATQDATLEVVIHQLRQQGKKVIRALEGQLLDLAAAGCSHLLRQQDGSWTVVAV